MATYTHDDILVKIKLRANICAAIMFVIAVMFEEEVLLSGMSKLAVLTPSSKAAFCFPYSVPHH